MKISTFLVGAAIFVSGLAPQLAAPAQAAPAPTYTSKKDGFAVYLPGKPVMGSRPVSMPGMGQSTVTFISVNKAPLAFVVIPLKLPGTPKGAAIDQFLDGVQRGFTQSAKAKLISSKKISLQGSPGREVLVQVGPQLIRGRFFVKGSRSYQILAVMPGNSGTKYNVQINQVLDSFRLL